MLAQSPKRKTQNHIPAHPAPGEHQVHLRFLSDSVATVLNLDALTGWVEIRGMRTQGGPGTGWITPRYIVTTLPDDDGDHGTDGHINWCPAKGAVQPHASGRLRLATWNLANLHSQNGQSIFADSEKRQNIDYERIRCYVRLMDPDILAVQEVDGAAALQRVVDTDIYDVHISSRLQGSVGKQNTGFAYRKGLQVTPQPDVTTLNTSGGLRHGTRIDLTHNGHTLKLMSVHLKSGCFTNASSGPDCTGLMAQIPPLEQWIDTAAADTEPFIVLGDFNRRLNESGDQVWSDIDDAIPPHADLTAITQDMPISCRDNTFDTFIDHMVFDARSIMWVERSSFRQMTYRQADKAVWGQISDHCPVIVEMWIE